MRGIFGILGLVITVLVIGLLAKKQLTSVSVGGAMSAASASATSPGVTPQQQSQQMQEQVRSSVENAMQKNRAMSEEQ